MRPIGKQLTSDDSCVGTANRSWCCRRRKRQRQHQSKANSRSVYSRSTDCRSTDCHSSGSRRGNDRCYLRNVRGNDRRYLRNVRLRGLGDLREHDRQRRSGMGSTEGSYGLGYLLSLVLGAHESNQDRIFNFLSADITLRTDE